MDDPKNASHGELVSLREYIDMRFCAYEKANEIRFNAQEKAVAAALTAADRAIGKTESATQYRFEGVNEFRAALEVYVKTLMPRGEVEAIISTMREKIDSVTDRVNAKDAASGGRANLWGWIVGAVGALMAILMAVGNMIGAFGS